jgi:hypothetical protein
MSKSKRLPSGTGAVFGAKEGIKPTPSLLEIQKTISAKMTKDMALCQACGKKFNKNEFCVQCTVCGLWALKVYIGMTDKNLPLTSSTFSTSIRASPTGPAGHAKLMQKE